MSAEEIERAKAYRAYQRCRRREDRAKYGATAMHDVTEGGVLGLHMK